ncbi:hypothetical protein D9757_008834 [Collybiopsis confluens]|uniref:Ricin B lectin domain-containing protein n=1 Tax=Collybiopsis confluens TaxID=2823264 RepID=A0A8H5M078_9AGAR|nr:hypothetical protein D9757_008834 [Collybiopsis confluens]
MTSSSKTLAARLGTDIKRAAVLRNVSATPPPYFLLTPPPPPPSSQPRKFDPAITMSFTKLFMFLFALAGLSLVSTTPVRVPKSPISPIKVVPRATELIQSGSTFTIHNVKGGTVVDLSAGDNKTITGWTANGGKNQQWNTLWAGNSWNIQSVETGFYLGFSGTAANGTNLTVSSTPTGWDIWHDEVNATNYRIFAPNTTQNWDLFNFGSSVAGNPITLWQTWSGVHQTWNFQLLSAG